MHLNTSSVSTSVTVPPSREAQVPVFVRMPRLRQMTGLGRSTIYRLMAQNLFPSPMRLGPRAVGWRLSDIDAWSAARPIASH